jgi:hypothetical protein
MASDTAILEVLEADLRSLCNEARKTDSLATQITGWLQHTNSPQIKESAERALVIVRATVQEGHGIEGIKTKVLHVTRSSAIMCWMLVAVMYTLKYYLYGATKTHWLKQATVHLLLWTTNPGSPLGVVPSFDRSQFAMPC